MARTYVPQLRVLNDDLRQYIARYQVRLDGSLDAPTMEKLAAVEVACTALALALGTEILIPDAEPL